MDTLIDRVKRLFPILFLAALVYFCLAAWLWHSNWLASSAVTDRLAVGDSAKQVITFTQAVLAFLGTFAFPWFLVAPKRNIKYAFVAISPYLFTWLVISVFGANSAFEGGTDYKYCSYDDTRHEITAKYDLSVEVRKKSPPYYDPINGRQLISCAEAERRKQDSLTRKLADSNSAYTKQLPTSQKSELNSSSHSSQSSQLAKKIVRKDTFDCSTDEKRDAFFESARVTVLNDPDAEYRFEVGGCALIRIDFPVKRLSASRYAVYFSTTQGSKGCSSYAANDGVPMPLEQCRKFLNDYQGSEIRLLIKENGDFLIN